MEKATQEAEIAKREKEIELQAKEAEVTEKKLDAEIKKKADADLLCRRNESRSRTVQT